MEVIVHKDISDRSCLENSVAVMDEIRQDGETVLSSSDGISIPMIFRNLSGRNFSGKEYRDYLEHIAYDDMGFVPGIITLWRGGRLVAEAKLEKTTDK